MTVTDRMTARRPTAAWLAILATAGVAATASVALFALGAPTDRALLRIAAYAAGYLLAGSVALLRRPDNRVGLVLLAIAVAGSLTFIGRVPDPAIQRFAGFAGSVSNLLIAWVTLAAPTGKLAPGIGRWLLVAFGAILLIGSFVTSLDVLRVAYAFGVVISLLIAGVVLRRWIRASGASRRSLAPVLVAGVAISLVHAVDYASGVILIQITVGSPVYWAEIVSRMLVPFGFLLGLLRLRMARGALADLVVDLGMSSPPGGLRQALAGALGDPTIAVFYWSPAAAAYLDSDGAAVEPDADSAGRVATYIEQNGAPLAAIVHDPALAEDPGLVAAAAAAVRLAVDNERLTAEVDSQLAEVRASRARIVEAGDAERRRLERDLHDGAQQRIVSMTLALRLAQAHLDPDADPDVRQSLEQASLEAKAALAELRELARGIHPQILTEAGLGAAVASLAERSRVPVTVDVSAAERYPAAVESAAYFVVSEALVNVAKYASATRAAVRGSWRDDVLTIEVSDDGVGGAQPSAGGGLRGLVDRLAAVGGTLDVSSPVGGGTRVAARIPDAPRSDSRPGADGTDLPAEVPAAAAGASLGG